MSGNLFIFNNNRPSLKHLNRLLESVTFNTYII